MVMMKTNAIIKTYSELLTIRSFEDRFRYVKLNGSVGIETFGFNRFLNQHLYRSDEWRRFRRDIILRDSGCDLAHDDFEIFGKIIIHHINPITVDDVLQRNPMIFDPENVVCVSMNTHNAIHYSDESVLPLLFPERTKNDTCPWKK